MSGSQTWATKQYYAHSQGGDEEQARIPIKCFDHEHDHGKEYKYLL